MVVIGFESAFFISSLATVSIKLICERAVNPQWTYAGWVSLGFGVLLELVRGTIPPDAVMI